MLPTREFFKKIECPYYVFTVKGSCLRPHCHFKHSRRDVDYDFSEPIVEEQTADQNKVSEEMDGDFTPEDSEEEIEPRDENIAISNDQTLLQPVVDENIEDEGGGREESEEEVEEEIEQEDNGLDEEENLLRFKKALMNSIKKIVEMYPKLFCKNINTKDFNQMIDEFIKNLINYEEIESVEMKKLTYNPTPIIELRKQEKRIKTQLPYIPECVKVTQSANTVDINSDLKFLEDFIQNDTLFSNNNENNEENSENEDLRIDEKDEELNEKDEELEEKHKEKEKSGRTKDKHEERKKEKPTSKEKSKGSHSRHDLNTKDKSSSREPSSTKESNSSKERSSKEISTKEISSSKEKHKSESSSSSSHRKSSSSKDSVKSSSKDSRSHSSSLRKHSSSHKRSRSHSRSNHNRSKSKRSKHSPSSRLKKETIVISSESSGDERDSFDIDDNDDDGENLVINDNTSLSPEVKKDDYDEPEYIRKKKKQRIAHVDIFGLPSTPPPPVSNRATVMNPNDRFKQIQEKYKGLNRSQPPPTSQPVKIAHVPNVNLMLTAKKTLPPSPGSVSINKNSLLMNDILKRSELKKTIAQTSKKNNRVAHVPPTAGSVSKPMIQVDAKTGTRIPLVVRQTCLDRIFALYSKYVPPDLASGRAVQVEMETYEKCHAAKSYQNSIANSILRIRKEQSGFFMGSKPQLR